MKAAFYAGNRTIQLGECRPLDPGPGQVQIRVSHCGVCGTDLHIFHGAMDKRVKMPAILGHEMSGVITAAGPGVSDWREGDRVTVMPLDPCGACPACNAGHSHICQKLNFIGIDSPGAFQSLWTVAAKTLLRLPPELSLAHGALVEPLAVACHDVRLAEIRPGEHVVVIGGGPIGMLVALVARHAGGNVVVAEVNPFRVALAKRLGLEAVNPKETDAVRFIEDRTGGAGADAVFEVSGSKAGVAVMPHLLRTRGRMVVVAIFAQPVEIDLFRVFWRELKLIGVRVYEREDFAKAIKLAASGELPLDALITETTSLDGLGESFAKMDSGGECMKILIDCSR
jgi:(R,R)-butanediol dehydrogenase / meso-butanediol dehydrogenase / diacetyl reductase